MGRLKDLIRGNVILARKQLRYKQTEISAALGVSGKTVSDWETGRTAPSFDHLDELAKFYGFEEGSEWFGIIRPEAIALIMDADRMRDDLILKMAEDISRKRASGGGDNLDRSETDDLPMNTGTFLPNLEAYLAETA